MKTRWFPILCAAAIAASAGAATGARAGDWTGDVNFILGAKYLDESDWEPLEEHAEFAATVSFGQNDWPIRIAIDLVGSAKEETGVYPFLDEVFEGTLEASTSEFGVGVRKVWTVGKARPFVGGGLAWIRGEIQASSGPVSVSFSDTGTGLWIDGGAFWRLGAHFNLGVEARVSRATIEPIEGVEGEAGGTHLGLILGFGW